MTEEDALRQVTQQAQITRTRRKLTGLEISFSMLSDDLMDDIDQIAIKYQGPETDVHDAIRAWFGDDTLEAYLDWRSEGDV